MELSYFFALEPTEDLLFDLICVECGKQRADVILDLAVWSSAASYAEVVLSNITFT